MANVMAAAEEPLFAECDESVVSSIAKAIRLLRALVAAENGEAGVTHLALAAGLPKSTTHRLLSELIHEGLVARRGSRYCLGSGWYLLRSTPTASEWDQLANVARRPLDELFEATGATVHLGVLDEDEVLYLDKLTARGGTRVPSRVGNRMPSTCTALGKAMLAHGGRLLIRTVLSKDLPRLAPRSIAAPNLLLEQLAQVRTEGLAFDFEESQPGVSCVGAPIMYGGRAVGAVSLTRVGSDVLNGDGIKVRRAASQIAASLLPC
ncbi:MAG TPA: IclR family transcriptional regulator [Acidimicrobiales bacterium]|nr:IclR family transcriptional regulator [Acidimicrobiales bacterium]